MYNFIIVWTRVGFNGILSPVQNSREIGKMGDPNSVRIPIRFVEFGGVCLFNLISVFYLEFISI